MGSSAQPAWGCDAQDSYSVSTTRVEFVSSGHSSGGGTKGSVKETEASITLSTIQEHLGAQES